MNGLQIKAVLFDLDGTLVDSAPELGAAADKMRVARGLAPLSSQAYRPMAGAGARGMLGIAFDIAPEHPNFAGLREEFFSNYEGSMLANTPVFAEVSELIAALLDGGFLWGVVTNKSVRFTGPLTGSIPLFATAGTIVSGDTTPFSKPHPAPLLEAARRLGVDPAECVYVGDDIRDIVAGQAAGMSTIAASYGYRGGQSEVDRWGADAVIDSPLALLKCLKVD